MQATQTTNNLTGFQRCVRAVVAELPLARYLEDNGIQVKQQGLHKVCLCPLHSEKTPSFTIYGDSSFYCFGCQEWGDVVSLHARLDSHQEQWTALVELSLRYNIELPQRSQKWHAWQKEKHKITDLSENIRFQTRCRRAFKALILNAPEIQSIEDPAERREEIRLCWEAFQQGMRKVAP